MVTQKAQHKLKVLKFWKQYGLSAVEEAFGVKKRTLYGWQAKLLKGNNNPESLNELSKRPKSARKRHWPEFVINQIKRLRYEHPNLGKDKIQVFIAPLCEENNLPCPSVSTIGNLIRDLGELRKFPVKVRHNGKIVPRKRAKRIRKPKHFKAEYPGHCGSLDTVEKVIYGSKSYV